MTTHLIRSDASCWKECPWRSFLASRLRVGLALLLAGLSICAAAFLPDALYGPPTHPLALPLFHLSAVLVLVVVVGLPSQSMKRMTAAVTAGENYILRWPGHPVFTILLSGGKWLICFLVGPSVLAGAGYMYWSRSEHPSLVDVLILTELGFLAVAFWLFMLLAMTDLGRSHNLGPAVVAEPAFRLGCAWLVVVLTAAVLLLVHGGFLIASVKEDHRKPLQGLLLLAVGARLLSSRGRRLPDQSGQPVEQRWYQFLVYPFRASRLCVGLTLFLTGLSVCAATFLPDWFNEPSRHPWALPAVYLSEVLVLVLVVGLPCSSLECVLASAAAGEASHTRRGRNSVLAILFSGVNVIACFLAGPCVFAVAGYWYWLQLGDPSLVDFLILAELGVVGVAYWIFLLLALTEDGRLRDFTPPAVVGMAHRLGWPGLAAVLTAALLVLAHGWFLTAAVEQVHRTPMRVPRPVDASFLDIGTLLTIENVDIIDPDIRFVEPNDQVLQVLQTPLQGLLMLMIVCGSAAFFSTFFCRFLGVWCYRTRAASAA